MVTLFAADFNLKRPEDSIFIINAAKRKTAGEGFIVCDSEEQATAVAAAFVRAVGVRPHVWSGFRSCVCC
jgi:hypothetical protein